MHPNKLQIKEGAILVADAHYASYRPLLLKLLEAIESQKIQTPQLILLGDNVDLLMGGIGAFERQEAAFISKLNRLSQSIEVVLFEGNHDFNLKKLFKEALVVPFTQQPMEALYKESLGLLAHGDWNEGWIYTGYTYCIRAPFVLFLINLLDRLAFGCISAYFTKKMQKKNLCRTFKDFEKITKKRLNKIDKKYEWMVEGHFHQGAFFKRDKTMYHNLDAMACNKSYFVVQSDCNVLQLLRKAL